MNVPSAPNKFQAGDRVRRVPTGEVGVVMGVDGDPYYEVSLPEGLAIVHADELELLGKDPLGLLAAGQYGPFEAFSTRLQALYLTHAYRYDPLAGLSSARIEPQMHQVFVAHRVMQKLQPRLILADEVGLGKTIEAGLIVKELIAREIATRVLIVVPANLVPQWRQELASKFNLEFEIMDRAGLRFLGRDGANPWEKKDRFLCSLPFAANPKVAERIIEAPWDLVIFDEAHRVRRWRQSARKTNTTQAYRLADELKELVAGLLMLTATPMQLSSFELYSLFELVEPGLYPTFEAYDERRALLPQLNQLMKALQAWEAMTDEEKADVKRRHQTLWNLVRGSGDADLPAVRSQIMDRLVSLHPLADVLVRNRKAEIGGFTKRAARRILVELTPEELQLYHDVTEYTRAGYNRAIATKQMAAGFVMVTYQKMLTSSSYALRQSLLRRISKLRAGAKAKPPKLSPERLEELADAEEASAALSEAEDASLSEAALAAEISQLQDLVDRLGKVRDSKALELLRAVREIFREYPEERVLVFTQFTETQEFLARALEANGFTVAVFHGSLSAESKEEAVRRFRTLEAQILISTEAGGEGRNFQFCHIMVNFDLPWNPMRVEQRIGRLDRIGQKMPVLVYNLASQGTLEERILDVLEQRIGLFEESVGSLEPILGDVERNIARIVLEDIGGLEAKFEKYEASLDELVRRAKAKEKALGDFVLDRASLRRDVASRLLGESPLARFEDLERFAVDSLSYIGGTLKRQPDGTYTAALSPQLASQLRQRNPIIKGVFDPEIAREREELQFFAFGHSLIDGIIAATRSQPLTTSTTCRRDTNLSAGLAVEVWYEIRAESLKPSGKVIRHLVGPDLDVRSEEVRALPQLGQPANDVVAPAWLADALKASRAQFQAEHNIERERVMTDENALKEAEIQRARRIFAYREVRFKHMIAGDEEWIAQAEMSSSERLKRILPARKGTLAKRKQALAALEDDLREQVQRIQGRKSGTQAMVLAASLVEGG